VLDIGQLVARAGIVAEGALQLPPSVNPV